MDEKNSGFSRLPFQLANSRTESSLWRDDQGVKELLSCFYLGAEPNLFVVSEHTHIPDQPLIGDLIPTPISQITGKHSNSLIDQIRDFQLRTRGAGEMEN